MRPTEGERMRRSLTIAIGLVVVLLVAVALAYDTWYCQYDSTDGKAFYHCTRPGCLWRWDQPAEIWPGHFGPPPKICPNCGTQTCYSDSAWCHHDPPHRYYPPSWYGYNY